MGTSIGTQRVKFNLLMEYGIENDIVRTLAFLGKATNVYENDILKSRMSLVDTIPQGDFEVHNKILPVRKHKLRLRQYLKLAISTLVTG